MIQIEISRHVIMQLEKAIEKYNRENHEFYPKIRHYSDMLSKVLGDYLE